MAPRLRVQLQGTIGTIGKWSNTLEFLLGAPVPSQSSLQAIANGIMTALAGSATFKPSFCTDTTLVGAKCLYYPAGTGASTLVATSSNAGIAGTAAPLYTPQVCVVASLRTASAGASNRGRTYVPYRASHINALGVVDGAGQTLIANYVNAVATAVATSLAAQTISATWVVWSSKLGSGTPIVNIQVGTQCDTIRHRVRNPTETYASFSPPSVTLTVPDADIAQVIAEVASQTIKSVRDDSPNGLADVLGLIVGAAISA